MRTVDWRDLYESNRAVIAAGRTRRALVHTPAHGDPGIARPLVCMLHGCTQDAETFAAATRMNDAADRHGFIVVYPQQERGENAQRCWNWFDRRHQARGAGEPASIAAVVRDLVGTTTAWAVDSDRVFVAGLSAGGAMAAVLAVTYPDLFAAVAVHSGLAYKSAGSVPSAFAAMARGGRKVPAIGSVPSLVIHGSADRTVAPVNGDQVLAQTMAGSFDLARPTTASRGRVARGHAYEHSQWADGGGDVMHERLKVDGLGHAWSGGVPGGSYTDPRGPDATEAIWSFFARVR